MEEAWRIPKPAGISSRGNCVMCYVLLWKLCYVHFTLCYVHFALCYVLCAMCFVLPWELCYVQGRAPQNSGQRPHKLCPTHSTGKKGGIPQRIPGLKGLPVIMANGSNLVFWGVNELVVSVAKAGMTI